MMNFDIFEKVENKLIPATGFEKIDEWFGGNPSAGVVVITGGFKTGKTLFMENIITNIMRKGHDCAFVLDDTSAYFAYKTIISNLLSIPWLHFEKLIEDNTVMAGKEKEFEIINGHKHGETYIAESYSLTPPDKAKFVFIERLKGSSNGNVLTELRKLGEYAREKNIVVFAGCLDDFECTKYWLNETVMTIRLSKKILDNDTEKNICFVAECVSSVYEPSIGENFCFNVDFDFRRIKML